MLSFFTQLNWVDLVIVVILLFYSIGGYSLGFVREVLDLSSFLLTFMIGLKTYTLVSALLTSHTQIPPGFAKAIGFFIVAFLAEIFLSFVFGTLKDFVLKKKLISSALQKVDKILGVFPGFFTGIVLLTFLITIVTSFAFSPFVRNLVASSKIGSLVLEKTQDLEKTLDAVFGEAANETINFLTIKPEETQTILLNFKANKLSPDFSSEKIMLQMVNKERQKRRLAALILDTKLRVVGRAHCEDMFKRGYFSHYTMEGLSPFDRLGQQEISFVFAGENLAFSQNVNLAMNGLMQSQEHRDNILSPNFAKIGIGVIDGGIYGEMFCQEFTD